jgi:hypothetical protein
MPGTSSEKSGRRQHSQWLLVIGAQLVLHGLQRGIVELVVDAVDGHDNFRNHQVGVGHVHYGAVRLCV